VSIPAPTSPLRGVAILGSTGSIGKSALTVLARQRDRFQVVALTAWENESALARQRAEWSPRLAGLVSQQGPELLLEAATHPDADVVLNAVVGAAGLDATIAALRAGKRVALANKEALVMAGDLVRAAAAEGGGELIPVDSEHSAVLQ
jgi:1-deoxy-D-xylulose-5-phosphate reductoisomerase